MRERWALQLVVLMLVLSLTGCQLLAAPLAMIQNLLPYLVSLFSQVAPLAALAVEAEPVKGITPEAAVVRVYDEPERMPALDREGLFELARQRDARSVALIDLRERTPRQIQRLVRRLEAMGGHLLVADASPLVGSPAARRALAEGLARRDLRLLDDGSVSDGEATRDRAYRQWRDWLDGELDAVANRER